MRFKNYLSESEEWLNATPKPVSGMQKKLLQHFIEALGFCVDYLGTSDKVPSMPVSKLNEFLEGYVEYKDVPALKKVWQWAESASAEAKKTTFAKDSRSDHIGSLKTSYKSALDAFKSGDFATAKSHAQALNDINVNLSQSSKKTDRRTEPFNNPLVTESGMFGAIFGGGRDTMPVNSDMLEKIAKNGMEDKGFSYLRFTKEMFNDFEMIMTYIVNMTDEPKPVRLAHKSFRDWIKYLYLDDDKYDELKKHVEDYLYSNKTAALKEIIRLLPEFPEIAAANQKVKAKVVFRGIGSESRISHDEIRRKEKERGHTATSTSRHAAMNFAYGRGHLEGSSVGSNEYSYMLTYDVTPQGAVLLDTSIFGSAFGESEIVIDTNKADLIEIEDLDDREERMYQKGVKDED